MTPQSSYTHEPIPGVLATTVLPQGCALVLEGGGVRGFYSSGVFETFMDAGIMFPYIVGVSAGAANVLNYVSGQAMRSRQIVEHYLADKRYLGIKHLLSGGSLFNMDFIFGELPEKHVAFDWDVFLAQQTKLVVGALDCLNGKTEWFDRQKLFENMNLIVASCSIPFLSQIVHYQDKTVDSAEAMTEKSLLDGGISCPIPIEKAIVDGNESFVIVLTRNAGYQKPPFQPAVALKFFYKNYPGVAKALLQQHTVYNRQLALCEQLEREGRAVIIRPQEPLQVGRTDKDPKKVLTLYDEGIAEAKAKLSEVLQLCAG